MLIIGFPLFQAGKILALRAKKWLSSVLVGREVILCFRQGRFWHYVLKSGYPLFQAGKVSITC